MLCRCLRVSRSGFYAWRAPAGVDARARRIGGCGCWSGRRSTRAASATAARAFTRDLVEQDVHVSRKRVVRLMQEEGLKARARKRFKCTTMSDHDQPVAANLLNREFTAEAPNQRWVGDTTEFLIGESGKLYLAAILDLFSRFVVGWAVSAVNDRHLTMKALEMALKRRVSRGRACCTTRTRAARTRARTTRPILDARGITCSMSRRGNCYDNAVMESFFSTVKAELGEHFESYGIAKEELFDYIEVFYNQRRRHSTLGQISPAAFERRAAA